jgi:predicted amidohydrolase YtcJ
MTVAASISDDGGKIAFGSGWPAAPLDPLLGLGAMLSRSERGAPATPTLDLASLIEAYTAAGAWASFDEQRKGSLDRGMLADVIVLDVDIFDAAPFDADGTHVALTIFDGKVVYKRPVQAN